MTDMRDLVGGGCIVFFFFAIHPAHAVIIGSAAIDLLYLLFSLMVTSTRSGISISIHRVRAHKCVGKPIAF